MMFKILVVTALLAVAFGTPGIARFCRRSECPKYQDLNTTSDIYQARMFYGAKWVGTDIKNVTNVKKSSKRAFYRLYNYINGRNANNTKMPMTVPVMNQWFMDSNYTLIGGRMNFYIPSAFQANAPAPTDKDVTVKDLPDTTFYYRAFGGLLNI